jgi:hypothetical protein
MNGTPNAAVYSKVQFYTCTNVESYALSFFLRARSRLRNLRVLTSHEVSRDFAREGRQKKFERESNRFEALACYPSCAFFSLFYRFSRVTPARPTRWNFRLPVRNTAKNRNRRNSFKTNDRTLSGSQQIPGFRLVEFLHFSN